MLERKTCKPRKPFIIPPSSTNPRQPTIYFSCSKFCQTTATFEICNNQVDSRWPITILTIMLGDLTQSTSSASTATAKARRGWSPRQPHGDNAWMHQWQEPSWHWPVAVPAASCAVAYHHYGVAWCPSVGSRSTSITAKAVEPESTKYVAPTIDAVT